MPTSWRRRSSALSRRRTGRTWRTGAATGAEVTLLSIAQQAVMVNAMDFSLSPRAADLRDRVRAFVTDEIEPIEAEAQQRITRLRESGGDSWTPDPVIGELQTRARAQGLWNLFLPAAHAGRYAADFGTDG